jgi:hypothetical protein
MPKGVDSTVAAQATLKERIMAWISEGCRKDTVSPIMKILESYNFLLFCTKTVFYKDLHGFGPSDKRIEGLGLRLFGAIDC